MTRKRNKQQQPVIGGVVGEDTTKQARVRRARKQAAEITRYTRKDIKIPNTEEILEIARTKEKA